VRQVLFGVVNGVVAAVPETSTTARWPDFALVAPPAASAGAAVSSNEIAVAEIRVAVFITEDSCAIWPMMRK
jgi:hypothetical protein